MLEPAECQQEVPVSSCRWDGEDGGGMGEGGLEVSCELLSPHHLLPPAQAARALGILSLVIVQSKVNRPTLLAEVALC